MLFDEVNDRCSMDVDYLVDICKEHRMSETNEGLVFGNEVYVALEYFYLVLECHQDYMQLLFGIAFLEKSTSPF